MIGEVYQGLQSLFHPSLFTVGLLVGFLFG
jgi:hypothetical protein